MIKNDLRTEQSQSDRQLFTESTKSRANCKFPSARLDELEEQQQWGGVGEDREERLYV